MIKVPFHTVLFSLIALVAIGGLVVPNIATDNNRDSPTAGACKERGTTVVIDFGQSFKLDGAQLEPIVRCVTTAGLTGWDLLDAAGLEVTGTSEYPASFVCRINDYPSKQLEDCQGTPGFANGSWSYFYATAATQGWRRSPVGAATRLPKCGEVEGWLFTKPTLISGETIKLIPQIEPQPFECK